MRVLLSFNLFLKSALVLVIVFVATDMLFASEDWAYDLRYEEFLTQAEQGSGSAMYELGEMTERGHGTTRNIEQAIKWYEKAIKNNNSSANVRLGRFYLEGVDVKKDYKKALSYFLKAKKGKSTGTYYYLAVMYENGYGIRKNLSLAKEYYDKADKWGHYGAKEKSNKIARLLRKKNKKNQNLIAGQPEVNATHKNQTKIDTTTEITKSKRQFVTIKDIKKKILTGMWFNGDSPLGFLPSPRTYCISKNKKSLRCVSKEFSRNIGREKVYYLIESNVSKIDNYGDFTISYKNKVTKVDVNSPVNESGEKYVSLIKVGLQKKKHILKCNVSGKNVKCKKDGMQNYVFVNLKKERNRNTKQVFEQAFE